MLKLQNGNRGFGHTIPMLAVVCCDMGAFFDSTERNEPPLDGGLFLMSFLLALQSLGLATCCLNWCVDPRVDQQGHQVGNIPQNEKILTFLAIGYAADDTVVPLSARRPLSDLIVAH
jgi:nitroreductase